MKYNIGDTVVMPGAFGTLIKYKILGRDQFLGVYKAEDLGVPGYRFDITQELLDMRRVVFVLPAMKFKDSPYS